jgi:superoxide dismutase, Cu-Zn family
VELKKAIFAAAAALLAGCATMGASEPRAVAQLAPTKGNSVTGTVTFTQRGGKVFVVASVSGFKPGSEHGFHVHEKGDCSSGDGMSAGGHFNPFAKPHGGHPSMDRHAGDMPNLRADANGNASATVELDLITVTDGPASVVGRAVIVHLQPDDYRSQPVGNAGARMACGVVQRA